MRAGLLHTLAIVLRSVGVTLAITIATVIVLPGTMLGEVPSLT